MNEATKVRDETKEKADQSKKELDDATNKYKDKEVHGAPLPVGTDARLFWYWLLLIFLFIFGFPINAIVFRLLGKAEIFTYIATGAIAIALLVSARYLGHFLREGKWNKIRIGVAVTLIIVPILSIEAISWLRQLYLSQVTEEIGRAWSQGMFFAFATFNLLIFIVAMVASCLAHDPLLFAVIVHGSN